MAAPVCPRPKSDSFQAKTRSGTKSANCSSSGSASSSSVVTPFTDQPKGVQVTPIIFIQPKLHAPPTMAEWYLQHLKHWYDEYHKLNKNESVEMEEVVRRKTHAAEMHNYYLERFAHLTGRPYPYPPPPRYFDPDTADLMLLPDMHGYYLGKFACDYACSVGLPMPTHVIPVDWVDAAAPSGADMPPVHLAESPTPSEEWDAERYPEAATRQSMPSRPRPL
ncbi:uncharacterized protein COLE_07469 [Cutaneotrichosporon oleaginosum]|nr:hypothetical protein COLE_07469 [Cutaneotrichosporon oleaginosum]